MCTKHSIHLGDFRVVVTLLALSCFPGLVTQVQAQSIEKIRAENWHQWRGPLATGVSPTAQPPIQWGPEKNLRWKVAVEGQGNSTPIIWGNKVFLLAAVIARFDAGLCHHWN